MQTTVLDAADGNSIGQVVKFLQAGDVVALPTETVYGLAGDALNTTAVARIFAAKDRPHFDPLIVHVANAAMAARVAHCDDPMVVALMKKFWPGPLTILLPKREIISDLVTAASPLVAVRMPSHPVFRAVLEEFGGPLAAPSANPFGRISPTKASHVVAGLGGRISLVLDCGKCLHGVESTIVYPKNGTLHLLREGPVTREELQAFGLLKSGTKNTAAPGQLASHYAPRKPLRLVDSADDVRDRERAGFLAFTTKPVEFDTVEILSSKGDLVEATANLFAALHRLDAAPIDQIYAEKIPLVGLGCAIMDRLNRAAAIS